jgi:iron-sulfur cluster insertion protein
MVTITDSAAIQFKLLIEKTGQLPRVEIAAGGCNGFDKKFSMGSKHADDIEVVLPNGAIVLIDPMSHDMLSSSVVDYKTNITGSFFAIEIPEAASTCGCGSSFSL